MIERLYQLFVQHPHISTDSRRITSGSIFFALRGESFDGNRYALSAIDQGAVSSVVDDRALLNTPGYEGRLIVVDDVLQALQQLAQRHRRELGIDILAITGSNGKTTTKELMAAVLTQRFPNLYATRGNFNNHIGVPLTLLTMDSSTDFGVVEMGASSCGEIALLCSIAEPNYGVVTNVGRAHLEGFGGEAGVRRGKGELMEYLQQHGGRVFVAAESDILMEMAQEREGLERVEYSYSLAEGVESRLEGEYNRYNIATAIAIGDYFGVESGQAREAIAQYNPTNNRSQRSERERNTLIIDCYNANPSSMEVAIKNFISESFPNRAIKIAVLGDMRELGEWSAAEHERVVRRVVGSSIDRIILVGKEFRQGVEQADISDPRIELFESCESLKMELVESPISNSALLIKGSRGVGLEQIVESL